jgi:hypothetical protein
MRDVALVAAVLVKEHLPPRPDPLAAVGYGTDHRLGNVEHPLRAAGEVEIATDVRACKRAKRRRCQRLQAFP